MTNLTDKTILYILDRFVLSPLMILLYVHYLTLPYGNNIIKVIAFFLAFGTIKRITFFDFDAFNQQYADYKQKLNKK